jgi:hypothetical protein
MSQSIKYLLEQLQDLLDLKQKQASVIEARAARKDTKSSADQAEASASLAYESFKQGWAIMIFTIVTIIFVISHLTLPSEHSLIRDSFHSRFLQACSV